MLKGTGGREISTTMAYVRLLSLLTKDKTIGNAEECKARGASVIAIVTKGDEQTADGFEDKIIVPKCPPMIATIPTTIILQLLSYHVAVLRGCDVDQPRNLAKSVTVE